MTNIIKNMVQDMCYVEMYEEIGITLSNISNTNIDVDSGARLMELDDNANLISEKMNGGIQEILLDNMGPDENGDSILLFIGDDNYGIYHRDGSGRTLYTYPGKQIKYLVNATERFYASATMLDSTRVSIALPSGESVFSVQINGTNVADFTYDGDLNILTIGDSFDGIIRSFNNNISLITYKTDQTIYGQIKMKYDSFQVVFDPITATTGSFFSNERYIHIDNYDALSINNTSEYFNYKDKGQNNGDRHLLNKSREVSFTLYRETKQKSLEQLVNGKKFRIILFNDTTGDFIYYTNCKLREGDQTTKQKTYDTVQVNITADDKFIIYFANGHYGEGLYGDGYYGNSYTFEVM